MPTEEPPSAVTARCPECRMDTLHSVLAGKLGTRGEVTTLDATVQCTDCHQTHHVIIREAKDIELPAVVSDMRGISHTSKISIPGDADVNIGEAFIVDGLNSKLTGIETKDMRRVDGANVKDVLTLWFKEFEELAIGFAINLDHKTITKMIPSPPDAEFTVGDEHLFGRLRVTVHAIKTEGGLIKRGTAEAAEIVRVFAKPTRLGTSGAARPDKAGRAQMREEEDKRAARKGARR